MERFDPFLNLNGIRVTCGKDSFIVDNLGVYGCKTVDAKDLIQNYFEKMITARGSNTEKFLQELGRVSIAGGTIFNTEGVIIRKEG